MNTYYLDILPEIQNKYKVNLQPGEKVIFTAKPYGFAADTGTLLGDDTSRITVTNRRILADNTLGIWEIDIAEDVVDMRRVKIGKLLAKQEFILVSMNKELTFGVGIQKLNGYRFHFRKKDMAMFEGIIEKMA